MKDTPVIARLWIVLIYTMVLNVRGSRMSCLQHEQGKEVSDTPWYTGPIASDHGAAARERWVYNNSYCPLELFSEEKFCTKAIECGRNLLLVGDSTVLRWANSLPFLLQATLGKAQCPSGNFCSQNNALAGNVTRCISDGHHEHMWKYAACTKWCPADRPVQIAYIRHDYLTNIHGSRYYRSAVCEHWKAVASEYDYVMVSMGPHIHRMLAFPYGVKATAEFNETAFLEQEARTTAEVLRTVLHPSATLIYRTGPTGQPNFQHDCSVRPLSAPPVIRSNYSWDKIPLLNDIYTNTLQEAFKDRFLLVDTMVLNSKMHQCRADHIHFLVNDETTPVLQEWLILYNILLLHDKSSMKPVQPGQAAVVKQQRKPVLDPPGKPRTSYLPNFKRPQHG